MKIINQERTSRVQKKREERGLKNVMMSVRVDAYALSETRYRIQEYIRHIGRSEVTEPKFCKDKNNKDQIIG